MDLPHLPISDLAERHPGLTPELAACFVQAAAVCLNQHHLSPVVFTLRDETRAEQVLAHWEAPNERQLKAWANQTDATEFGAYACALAAAEALKGLVAVQRAESFTGADFYLAPLDKAADDSNWETLTRLEISGTQLDEREVEWRLRKKTRQAAQGHSPFSALAAVVGFQVGLIVFQNVGKKS